MINSYVCEWCGVLENKDVPIILGKYKFCCNKCLDEFKSNFILIDGEYIHINVVKNIFNIEDISAFDLELEYQKYIDNKKRKMKTCYAEECIICGTIFYTDSKSLRKTCSNECLKIRQAQIGKQISLKCVGWASPGWKGGISYGEYCPKFNEDLRTRVREFFENKCFLCGKSQEEEKSKLSVHHVNYDKNSCCTNKPALFVPLCKVCHGKTNSNREYWENMFEDKLEAEYDYKCYYTKEEYAKLNSEKLQVNN